ncbi:hypothetical protein V8C42DRAFT_356647 [Trichoderma barbatum]
MATTMAERSDIEEGCSRGALERIGEEQQGKRDDGNLSNDTTLRTGNTDDFHHGHGDYAWYSARKGKGKLAERQGYDIYQQHQKSRTSATIIAPAIHSSSSSSSSRTITPPDNAPPPHRASSSGTVQIVSPVATSVTALSQTESSVWSPVSRPFRISGTISEAASSATVAGNDHHGHIQQRRRQNRQYALEGVPQASRPPFWWMDSSAVDLPRHTDDERDCLLESVARGGKEVKIRGVLHTVMHGVVLALQSGVSLGVLTLFAWMALWKDEDGGLSGIPGGMLHNMASLAATFVLVLSSGTLLVHEICMLSPVVLLYLQAAILALTTVSATSIWMNCVQEDDAVLKCALISCSILFWGTSALAFLRAAVVWKVTSLDDDEVLGQRRVDGEIRDEGYATFQGPGSG